MTVKITPDEFLKALAARAESYRVTGDIPDTRFELADGRFLNSSDGDELEAKGLIEWEVSGLGNRQRLKVTLTDAGRQYIQDLLEREKVAAATPLT